MNSTPQIPTNIGCLGTHRNAGTKLTKTAETLGIFWMWRKVLGTNMFNQKIGGGVTNAPQEVGDKGPSGEFKWKGNRFQRRP